MQIPRRWQSPITWRARSITDFVVVVLSLLLFAVGLTYPERQPLISVVTLGFLVLPVTLRLRYVFLVRKMKAAPETNGAIRFPFYSCDKIDKGAGLSQLEAREGWADFEVDSLILWVAKYRSPCVRKELGVPMAVSVLSPHRLLYDQLLIETTQGNFIFQVIRNSGTGTALAGSSAIVDLARVAGKYLSS
jgi:hypothetical protein